MFERYSRQMLFAPIGKEGQKIRSKHVLMIGAGALGSNNAEMLTRAGIGELTVVDRDYVEKVIFNVNSSIRKEMSHKSSRKRLQQKSG